MPQLNEIIKNKQKKKFKKKLYRPWDLSGDGSTQTNTEKLSITDSHIEKKAIEQVSFQEKQKKAQQENDNKSQQNSEPQLDHNTIKNGEQLDNNWVTTKVTVREQLDNTLNPNSLRNRIAKLSGIQRKILDFVVDVCAKKSALETGPVETKIMSQYVQATYGSAKTSLNRLIKKDFLFRKKGRTAKGGYINLLITEEIKQAVIDMRVNFQRYRNPVEIVNSIREQLGNELDNKLDNNRPYSSSNINTTTIKKEKLPAEWENIDYSVLSDTGFSKTQLKQLVNKTTPEIVQNSINHFAYGIANNPKVKKYTSPLNVLMGVLRKGQAWFESNYQSPQEIAQRQIIERKQTERGRMKKLEEEVYKLVFEEWKETLTFEQREKIAPARKGRGDVMPIDVKLSLYFKNKIWPGKKEEFLVCS